MPNRGYRADAIPAKGRRQLLKPLVHKAALALLAQTEKPDRPDSFTRAAMRIVLDLAAFVWLTFAGFSISSTIGCVVAGLSCFVMARHFSSPEPKTDPLLRN